MNIQQSYREASVQGANPVQLVVRLYEQLIEDMRQVAIAIELNDIERRSHRIKHAILVVGHLQSALDFTQGGKVANDLDNLYNSLRQSIVVLQFRPTKRGATQLITDLLALRESWIEVERAEYPTLPSVPPIIPSRNGFPQSGGAYEVAYASAPDPREGDPGGVQDAEGRRRNWNG
ncbi:MAG: flagellar export chaperone FliS [Terriglobales bacterium]